MSERHGSRAHVEFDYMTAGIRLALRRDVDGGAVLVRWQQPKTEFVVLDSTRAAERTEAGELWLGLQDDDARAIYEALAEHFGHTGNDVRALRRDYDAERGRVDKLIANLIAPPVPVTPRSTQ